MNCHIHSQSPSSDSCRSCGKALCSDCAARFTNIYCEECFIREGGYCIGKILRVAAPSFLLFFGMFLFVHLAPFLPGLQSFHVESVWLSIWLAFIAGVIPVGWYAIGFARNTGLSAQYHGMHPILRWWPSKVCAAMLIGVVMAPIYILKSALDLKMLARLRLRESETARTKPCDGT